MTDNEIINLTADEQIADMIRIIENRDGCDVIMGVCHTTKHRKCSWCTAERLYDAGYRKVWCKRWSSECIQTCGSCLSRSAKADGSSVTTNVDEITMDENKKLMETILQQQEKIAELNSIIISQKRMEDKYNRYYNLVGDLYAFLVDEGILNGFTSFHEDREIHRAAMLKKMLLRGECDFEISQSQVKEIVKGLKQRGITEYRIHSRSPVLIEFSTPSDFKTQWIKYDHATTGVIGQQIKPNQRYKAEDSFTWKEGEFFD